MKTLASAWRTTAICTGLGVVSAACFFAPNPWMGTIGLLFICGMPLLITAVSLYIVEQSIAAGQTDRDSAINLRLSLLVQAAIMLPMGLITAGVLLSSAQPDWIVLTMVIAVAIIGISTLVVGALLTGSALNAALSFLAGLFSLASTVGMAVIYIISPAITAAVAAIYATMLISCMLLFAWYLRSAREETSAHVEVAELQSAA